MTSITALRETYDSDFNFSDSCAPTSSKLELFKLPKEQILSRINICYPESSNQSEEKILDQELVTEEKALAESGSSSIHFLKKFIKKPVAFNSHLKREGIVLSINGDYFTARLTDLIKDAVDEVADFPFDEISDDDRALLEVGAVFYWNIGFRLLPSGQKERSSLIRFRRLPAWHRTEIQKAYKEADELADFFGW